MLSDWFLENILVIVTVETISARSSDNIKLLKVLGFHKAVSQFFLPFYKHS